MKSYRFSCGSDTVESHAPGSQVGNALAGLGVLMVRAGHNSFIVEFSFGFNYQSLVAPPGARVGPHLRQ